VAGAAGTAAGVWWWGLVAAAPCLWGVFDGIGSTASLALFADSIPDGERSYYFTLRTVLMTGGQIVGPLVALGMFAFLGDRWTVEDCGRVVCSAQLFLVPAFMLLWFFNDDDVMSATTTQPSIGNVPPHEDGGGVTAEEIEEHEHLIEQGREAITSNTIASSEEIEQQQSASTISATFSGSFTTASQRNRFIAISAAVSDVTCAFAQGLSFRYFALFLLNDLQLHPVMVQILDATTCVIASVLLCSNQQLSVCFGRCRIAIVFKLIGVVWLIAMTLLPTKILTASASAPPPPLSSDHSILSSNHYINRSLFQSHS